MNDSTEQKTSTEAAGRGKNALLTADVPPPPEPPPCRRQCGACGYTAPEPEYKHTCWYGISIISALALLPISALVILAKKLIGS